MSTTWRGPCFFVWLNFQCHRNCSHFLLSPFIRCIHFFSFSLSSAPIYSDNAIFARRTLKTWWNRTAPFLRLLYRIVQLFHNKIRSSLSFSAAMPYIFHERKRKKIIWKGTCIRQPEWELYPRRIIISSLPFSCLCNCTKKNIIINKRRLVYMCSGEIWK